jgi:anti-anti-sigma factor
MDASSISNNSASQNLIIEELRAPEENMTAKLIKFIGQLDESNIDLKAKIIYDIVAQYPKNLYLLFDFSKLEYMNSKSIGYLTDWYGRITEGEGKIVISNPPQAVLEILQAVGITELVKCYNTFDEAKFQLFQKSSNPLQA